MSRRLIALTLSLLLLLTQQWGTLHLLSHGRQGTAAAATVDAGAAADPQADAGDALCQICLVLAALGAAAAPVLWHWLARPPRTTAPLARPRPAALRPAPAPWHARGPPVLA